MNFWKVIYVSSRSERKVSERLIKLGIECYVPLKSEMKQWSDRKKKVISPIISGYVFVKPTALQRDRVLQQQGVLSYVRYNGEDARIRELEISALRSVEEKGYHVEGGFCKEINLGDRVQIVYGPFKGLQGWVKNNGNKRLHQIFIEGIGFQLTVQLPDEVLIKKEN